MAVASAWLHFGYAMSFVVLVVHGSASYHRWSSKGGAYVCETALGMHTPADKFLDCVIRTRPSYVSGRQLLGGSSSVTEKSATEMSEAEELDLILETCPDSCTEGCIVANAGTCCSPGAMLGYKCVNTGWNEVASGSASGTTYRYYNRRFLAIIDASSEP